MGASQLLGRARGLPQKSTHMITLPGKPQQFGEVVQAAEIGMRPAVSHSHCQVRRSLSPRQFPAVLAPASGHISSPYL